jgi:hypothetical protein
LEATTFANMFLLYLFRNHSLLCMLSLSHPICITSPCGTLCSHGHVLFRLHLWCPWVPQILAIRPFWVSIPTRSQLGALTKTVPSRGFHCRVSLRSADQLCWSGEKNGECVRWWVLCCIEFAVSGRQSVRRCIGISSC